jgi:hypothetical protein
MSGNQELVGKKLVFFKAWPLGTWRDFQPQNSGLGELRNTKGFYREA